MRFSFNKIYAGIGCALTLALSFNACKKAELQIGGQYVDDGYAQLTYVDSVKPVVTTEYIDSFVTSGLGIGTLGNFTDPNFGKLKASSYFQLQPPTYLSTLPDSLLNAKYDSITLLVKFNPSYWYGDTTQNASLSVYRLTDFITKYTNQTYLFNQQNFPAETTPLGSSVFKYRPLSGSLYDTISVRLDDKLGKNLYDLMAQGNNLVQNADNFTSYFKGLKISVGANTPGMGISDSIMMRVHYHKPSADNMTVAYSSLNFGLNDNSYQFNNITVDRAGTILGQQNFDKNHRSIPSAKLGNVGMVQSVSNAVAKIAFPNIQIFNNFPGLYSLSRGVLEIRPKRGTYESVYTLPPSLYLYQTDVNNTFGNDPNDPAGTQGHQPGVLSYDQFGAYYTFDVTTYIKNRMKTEFKPGEGLLLAPPSGAAFGGQFNSFIFGDGNLDGYQNVKLKLYFLQVNTSN